MWFPQTEALLDIRVTDADAPSYLTRSVGTSVLAIAEEDKKRKYVPAVEARCGSFSFCCDGRWCNGP